MTYGEILFLIFLGILFLTPIVVIVYYKIYDVIYKKQVEKSRKRNLPFYSFVDYAKEYDKKKWEFIQKGKEIKEQIDELIAELPYLTTEDRLTAERNLEYLRYELKENTEIVETYKLQSRLMWEQIESLRMDLIDQGEKIY